jgi:hypothetical protein
MSCRSLADRAVWASSNLGADAPQRPVRIDALTDPESAGSPSSSDTLVAPSAPSLASWWEPVHIRDPSGPDLASMDRELRVP